MIREREWRILKEQMEFIKHCSPSRASNWRINHAEANGMIEIMHQPCYYQKKIITLGNFKSQQLMEAFRFIYVRPNCKKEYDPLVSSFPFLYCRPRRRRLKISIFGQLISQSVDFLPATGMSAAAADGWKVVHPRRRRIRPKPNSKPKSDPQTLNQEQPSGSSPWTPSDDASIDPSAVANLIKRVQISVSKLESSAFYFRFISQIHHHSTLPSHLSRWRSSTATQMVIYGIGSISTHEPPRLQLALALLLHKGLGFLSPMEVFDPVISSLECAVMEELGCKVMRIDEKGRREVTSATLFYMPHCEAVMYDSLLGANWSKEGLNQMIVLGNSFREYEMYVTGMGKGSRVDGEAKFVVRASEFAEEIPIDGVGLEREEVDGLFNAFNLTSWHFFSVGDDGFLASLLDDETNIDCSVSV